MLKRVSFSGLNSKPHRKIKNRILLKILYFPSVPLTPKQITKLLTFLLENAIFYFCPALTKLALDLHVNRCVCLVPWISGLFLEAFFV